MSAPGQGDNVRPFQRPSPTQAQDARPARKPENLHAERVVLGTLMAQSETISLVWPKLQPEHFSDPVHAKLYGRVATLISDGTAPIPYTLRDWFLAHEDCAERGVGYLDSLIKYVQAAGIEACGQTVYETWQRRTLILEAERTIAEARDPRMKVNDVIERAEIGISSAIAGQQEQQGALLEDILPESIALVEQAISRGGSGGLNIGSPVLQRLVPFLPGKCIAVGGASGVGKSAVVAGWALAASYEARDETLLHGVVEPGVIAYFSLAEMDKATLVLRCACAARGIAFDEAQSGFLNEARPAREDLLRLGQTPTDETVAVRAAQRRQEKLDAFKSLRAEVSGLPIWFDDCGGLTPMQVAMKLKRLQRRFGLIRMVVIDYIQIMKLSSGGGGAFDYTQMVNELKLLASTFGCPVLLLSQVQADLLTRPDPRPKNNDFLWVRAVLYNVADAVIFVHRDDHALRQNKPTPTLGDMPGSYEDRQQKWDERMQAVAGQGQYLVRKNKGGRESWDVQYHWDGKTMRAEEFPGQVKPWEHGETW